jgi:lipopolysaccharide transport system permease protein
VIPAIILAIVLGQFARLPSAGVPYVLYALSGLTLFGLFSGVATRAGGSLLSDARLVTKVYFPRSLLPLASGTAAVVDFLVGLLVLVVAIIGFGRLPGAAIVFVPVIVSLTFFAAMAIGLAIAGLSAYYRDFAYVVPFVLQVLLYASPVVYAYELVPAPFRLLFSLNPLVPLIQGFRAAVLGTPPPTLLEAAVGLIVICVMALLGVATFERTSRNLTDVI